MDDYEDLLAAEREFKEDRESTRENEETEALDLFLTAYRTLAGRRLELVKKHERPDFVCRRPGGELVGVELVRVFKHREVEVYENGRFRSVALKPPEGTTLEHILERGSELYGYDAWEAIRAAIESKAASRDNARARPRWFLPNCTILVIQLLETQAKHLESWAPPREDFEGSGFSEIWCADYTGIPAYGDLELFCVSPSCDWGYYGNDYRSPKPYG